MIYNNNKINFNIIGMNYEKIRINYYFLNYKYIIFFSDTNIYNLKNILLNYNIQSIFLKENYIKSIFNLPMFSFLRSGRFLCIFTNDVMSFINVVKILENKYFFYSYKKCLSNIILNTTILKEYDKYKLNYKFIQFISNKIKIKIILLFLFLFLSLVKYIK